MTGIKKGLPAIMLVMVMLLSLLAGCGQTASTAAADADKEAKSVEQAYIDGSAVQDADISEEAVALLAAPALFANLTPVASGTLVRSSSGASIDYSNTSDGYVMVKYSDASSQKIKAQVTGPSGTTYTYNLQAGASDWTTFPLSDGNGSYKVAVYRNTTGTKYSTVLSITCNANMTDEFAPFLRPNQYVDYTNAVNTVAKAAELTKGLTDPLAKVKAVYEFVVKTLKYDRAKASSVQSGYLPVLDTVLAQKKGICFDYASLMTAMLRSQGVPCKLVVGYAGNAYHAWISVWSEETGWVNAAIYFDGTTWQRMDPTFASSGKQSASVMKYIGDGSHYTEKYIY